MLPGGTPHRPGVPQGAHTHRLARVVLAEGFAQMSETVATKYIGRRWHLQDTLSGGANEEGSCGWKAHPLEMLLDPDLGGKGPAPSQGGLCSIALFPSVPPAPAPPPGTSLPGVGKWGPAGRARSGRPGAAPAAGPEKRGGARRAGASMEAAAAALAELRALVERAGGRPRLLLVAERRPGEAPARALLESFARDLLGEPPAAEKEAEAAREEEAAAGSGGAGGGRGWPRCALALLLCRAAAGRRARRCLREVVRDVRGQLPAAAGLVGVLVAEGEGEAGPAEREAERARLEALLRRVCPALGEALQAAHYSPGSPQGAAPVRAAACRALRAALQLRADGVETEKQRLPGFLRCFSWGRRSQKTTDTLDKPADTFGDDGPQEAEEGVALTNMAPNGNCEEIGGVACT
ncbi:uncharacterized protein C2orf72 homolog [Eublepharis macularius]|uniref:Uncharacterized protein C2orf72 homolog n=1 Tax=Eublepharis macularius TaxID=481883 RepID=A0AA97JH63_EUBMA|nr:uncharacterized protein C2orf72 homolog [Eublepharis macularius]